MPNGTEARVWWCFSYTESFWSFVFPQRVELTEANAQDALTSIQGLLRDEDLYTTNGREIKGERINVFKEPDDLSGQADVRAAIRRTNEALRGDSRIPYGVSDRLKAVADVVSDVVSAFARVSAPHGQAQSDYAPDEKTATRVPKGELRKRILTYAKAHVFQSLAKTAVGVGLSASKRSSVANAIKGCPELEAWRHRGLAERKANRKPRATSLNEVHVDRLPQRTEPDPAVTVALHDEIDAELARLLQEADEDERSRLNGMGAGQLRELAAESLEQRREKYREDEDPRGNRLFESRP